MSAYFNVHLSSGSTVKCSTKQEVFSQLKANNDITVLYKHNPSARKLFSEKAAESLLEFDTAPNICLIFSINKDCEFIDDLPDWIENSMLDVFYCNDYRPYIEEIIA